MHASLVLALGGESSSDGNTAITVISAVSIVFGWLLLAGLWWFVFRDKARGTDKRDSSD